MAATWLIGALMAATGSVLSNLGVNCQKYSFMQNAKLPKALQRKHIRQRGWLLGMALVVLGAVGDFVALSLAAQSIVAPIGSITLVANVFFAHYWLQERVGWVELIGTTMIVSGSVLAVTFGDHSDVAYDIHAILSFFLGISFIVYAIASIALGLALYRFQLPITPLKQKIVDATRRYELAYEAGNREQMEYEDFYIASLQRQYSKWERVHPFTICALSGILGGQSVMFGKMVSEMINVTASGDNQLFSPFFYIFIACMLACVVGQLQYLAIALNFFDALYVVPVFQCFFISFSTLGGACFFNEFAAFSVVQALLFPIGLLTTLGGVVVLTRRKMGQEERKRFIVGEEEGQLADDAREMEVIEEGDEAADELEQLQEENEVLKMEKRRRREERKRRRRLRRKRKQGYEGLEDEDEEAEEQEEDAQLSSDLSEDETEPEEEQEAEDDDFRRRYRITTTGDSDKGAEEVKTAHLPAGSPHRHSPVRPVLPGQSPPSSASTPSSRGASRPSSPRPRDLTPLPLIDDIMAASVAVAGVSPASAPTPSPPAPVPSADRRASLTAVLPVTERRPPADRRLSLPPRRTSPRVPFAIHPPTALSISTGAAEDGSTPPPPAAAASGTNSAPSTPPSLSHHPSIFRAGSSSPAAAQSAAASFMQPSVSLYLPPPTGLDLWTKEEKLNDKVKKYSSVVHHAGGLVGVPIVSAIAHAWVIGREEREEEMKEKREAAAEVEGKRREEERKGEEKKEEDAAAAAAGPEAAAAAAGDSHAGPEAEHDADAVEMSSIAGHRYTDEYAAPSSSSSSILIPVAEPVHSDIAPAVAAVTGSAVGEASGGVPAGHHHAHSGSIMHRLKDRIKLVFHSEGKEKGREAAAEAAEAEQLTALEEGETAAAEAGLVTAETEDEGKREESQQPLIEGGAGGSEDSELRLEEESSTTAADAAEPSVSRLSIGDVTVEERGDDREEDVAEEAELTGSERRSQSDVAPLIPTQPSSDRTA